MSNEVATTVTEVTNTVADVAVPAQKVANTATRLIFKGVGKVRRFSPQILMGIGVAGVVTAGVLACRATLKLHDVVDESNEDIAEVKGKRSREEYETESDFNRALTLAYTKRAVKVAKVYTPALSVFTVSLGCILGSHGIMNQRNVAMAAAVKAGESAFAEYRKRVVDEFGEEKDRDIRFGIVEKELPVYDDEGNQTGTKKVMDVQVDGRNEYVRCFDENNEMWSKVPGQNQLTLSNQQNWLNDRLNARGYVFLNDVYKCLGFPATPAGQVTGWLRRDHEDSKDGYIDFGLMDIEEQGKRDFVNGFERSCWLDFNVDGIIFDKL
jgi:uncharacterized lipoprotein NlpE involved in copper resistance